MKKIFSLLLAVVLVFSLAVPAFAATGSATVVGTSTSSSSSSTSASIGMSSSISIGTANASYSYTPRFGSRGPVFPTYKYAGTVGEITNFPVTISGFNLSSKRVRVQLGKTIFYGDCTHKLVGGKWETTITANGDKYNRTIDYGFGSNYVLQNAMAGMRIVVKHYGSSVSAHTVRTSGIYVKGSHYKFAIWDKTVASTNAGVTSTATVDTCLRGSTFQGYFETDVFFAARGTGCFTFKETDLVELDNQLKTTGTPPVRIRYYLGGKLKEKFAVSYNKP